ncbi:hypothetical protein [Spiroplasma citri]|uniref:hypothetical protein n=1 Tax=Spiroplasma citri TaxID=2133 RepID=UPI001EF8D7ED|nr:hypothetical protein [Spiroplasma citri]
MAKQEIKTPIIQQTIIGKKILIAIIVLVSPVFGGTKNGINPCAIITKIAKTPPITTW